MRSSASARTPPVEPVAGVREERVGEALAALVGERVGVDRRAQQAEAELVAERVVAVLAVVEQRHAVARLGEVGEAVGGDLEAGDVPGGVAVRRAADRRRARIRRWRRRRGPRAGSAPSAGCGARASRCRWRCRAGRSWPRAGRSGRSRCRGSGGSTRIAARCGPRSTTSIDARRSSSSPWRGVVLLDVPGVPVARLVDVGPDLVAAVGERLAAGALVEDAGERAVGASISTRRRSFSSQSSPTRERAPAVVSRIDGGGEAGDRGRAGEDAAAFDGLAAGQRVGRRRGGAGAGERSGLTTRTAGRVAGGDEAGGDGGEAVGGDAVAFGDDAGELVLGFLVDLADAGAGQDVVELVAQEHAPVRLQRRRAPASPRRVAIEASGLGGDERALGAAVEVLGAALGGERAAVELEVHLADPDRQGGVVADAVASVGEPVLDLGRAQARARRGSPRTGAGGRASPRSGRRRRRRSRRRAGSRGWRTCRGSSSRSRARRAGRSRRCSRRPGC